MINNKESLISLKLLEVDQIPDVNSLEKENRGLRAELTKIKNEFKQLAYVKQQLEAVVTNVPVVLWMIDNEGIFTLSEGAGLVELGLKPGQVVGMSVFDIYANFPEIISAHKDAFTGKDSRYSFKMAGIQNIENVDPIDVYFDARVKPYYSENGEIQGLIGIAYDTTFVKRAEIKLAEKEMRYRTLINASPLGVLVHQQGICKFANPAFLEIFGYNSLDEIIDFPIVAFLAPEVREELHERSIKREKGEKEPPSYETLGMKKNETIFPIQVDANKIIFNELPSVMVYFRDISNMVKLSREKDLLQEQLLLSQKLESLGMVAGGVAHDFNNLLLGIMGNSSLLESRVMHDKEALSFVKEIQKISKEAANLTKQMLAYTGKSTLNQVSTNLNDVLNEINKLITLSVSKSISVKYDLSPNSNKIIADVSQLKQIILNLIINASESIGDKNGVITVITGTQKIDKFYKNQLYPVFDIKVGNYSYIEVADNGIGIEKNDITRIFDPFYSTKFTGRGLGLSVVHGIVKAHNGAIKVYSEVNKGSSFKVLFPITTESIPVIKDKQRDFEEIDQTGMILFCDDDPSIRKVGEKMLSYLGFTTKLASNGLEAIKYMEQMQNEIILVILDLTMPVMTGKETLSKLRQISVDIPVIISSGHNEIKVVELFRGRPNISFLQKPYTLSILKNEIFKHLK